MIIDEEIFEKGYKPNEIVVYLYIKKFDLKGCKISIDSMAKTLQMNWRTLNNTLEVLAKNEAIKIDEKGVAIAENTIETAKKDFVKIQKSSKSFVKIQKKFCKNTKTRNKFCKNTKTEIDFCKNTKTETPKNDTYIQSGSNITTNLISTDTNYLSKKSKERCILTNTYKERDKSLSFDDTVETLFSEFWSAYPSSKRKVNKKACLTAYKNIKNIVLEHNNILTGLERWKKDKDWKKDNGQFIPAPLVFLHQRRWEAINNVQEEKEELNETDKQSLAFFFK